MKVADRTPQHARRPEGRPNRQYERRGSSASVVIGVLLLLALVVGAAVWNNLRQDDTPGQTTGQDATDASGGTAPVAGLSTGDSSATVTAAPAPGLATIADVVSYDPDGDGDERPEFAALAIDGDPDTAWGTLCYIDRYMGAKGRVGLVVDLGAVTTATLRVAIASSPSQVRIFAASTDTMPATFDDWGTEVARFADAEPVKVEATVTGRWALIALYELGPDQDCADNPYRGQISEITVVG